MSLPLQNKVALITGAASGIGRAVAERFVREGARVVAFDRDQAALEQAFPSGSMVCCVGDVRFMADHQRAVALALERFGRLDILVANAGIYDNRQPLMSFPPESLEAAFDELFAINVKGYLLAARAAADALSANGGAIVMTSSISGSHAGFGGPLYVAAKHAVNGLVRQLALELAPAIRVNAVAPGYVPTGLRGLDTLGQGPSAGGPAPQDMPLQRIAQPDDYAAAYVFLASDASAGTATGSVLELDGGSALRGPRR